MTTVNLTFDLSWWQASTKHNAVLHMTVYDTDERTAIVRATEALKASGFHGQIDAARDVEVRH